MVTKLKKCQCTECDCHSQTVDKVCRSCFEDRHANLGFFDLLEKEREEVTPEYGYNICMHDEFCRPGDSLTVIDHADTKEEAEKIAERLGSKSGHVYIFGNKDVEKGK